MTVSAKDTFSLNDLRDARQLGTLYSTGPVIVVHLEVMEAVLDFSEQDQSRERGGFLLGGVYGEGPQYVVVRHFHPASAAHGSGASLTFTHDTWAELTREIATHFPDDAIVGWQHTHPGLGVFLSGYDLFIHKNFFSQPWQIAMVVDSRRREFGFFHWREGEVRDCGFLCAAEF